MEQMDMGMMMNMILPFVCMGAIFYFMLYRPQKKEQKQRREMLDALKRGDNVITIGGLCGKVDKIHDDKVILVTDDGVKLTFMRSAIGQVLEK